MILPSKILFEVLDNLLEGVYFVDTDRTITYWNKSAERITGFSASEVLGTCCQNNILNHVDRGGAQLCENGCPVSASIADGRERDLRLYIDHRDGHRLPVRMRVKPVRNDEGDVIGAIETFIDTSAHVAALEKINELREIALLDPLTRLGNRHFTELTIDKRLEEFQRYGWTFGLLFVDIDFFKAINDTFGHRTGDEALKMVATTLRSSLRPFDFAGRWGGDEFVALVVNVAVKDFLAIAERLRCIVHCMSTARIEPDRQPSSFSVSIGATMVRPDDTAISLVERADQLMYRSKDLGRNRITADDHLDAGEVDLEVNIS